MSELSFDGYNREPDKKTARKPQRVLDTRYVNSREQFLSDPRFKGIETFSTKVWLSSPTMHGDEQKWVDEAIQTNWVSTVGENINVVEKLVAAKVGRKYAVALSSGTAALHLAIRLAGERLYGPQSANVGTLQGKKVFCSDTTFDATVNPVAYEGGEAVFIDSELDTWNMCPEALEKAFELYPEVKLIVLAHLYGTPAKVDEIRRIADKHGALIVEDAAESFGSKVCVSSTSPFFSLLEVSEEAEKSHSSLQTGMFGDYSIISFIVTKILTSKTDKTEPLIVA